MNEIDKSNLANLTKQNEIKQKLTSDEKKVILRTKYKYKKKPIGKGSFATVFFAVNAKGEKFALKRIELSKLDPKRMDKFMLELEISQKISHENIVKCFDVIKTDHHWFLVNELCDGGTFEEIITEFKKIDTQQRELHGHHYLSQLKNALCYLHSNSIIHRDLKPANILIKKLANSTSDSACNSSCNSACDSLNEIVKLADFGLARYFENKSQNSDGYDNMIQTMCGSPIYMAPEIILNDLYNIKADLWSFGIIMYELLYGTNPYNYPKSISNLGELMKSKKISFPNTLTPICINLLQNLLKVDPVERLSWNDFNNHEWFQQILTTESDESIETFEPTKPVEPIKPAEPIVTFDDIVGQNSLKNQDNKTNQLTNESTNQLTNESVGKLVDKNKTNATKTIEIDINDREKAFEMARNMQDTFQLLKHRGRVFSDIKKDPDVSPFSSMENTKMETGSMFYDLTENFLDKHFGHIGSGYMENMSDTFTSVESVNSANSTNATNSTNSTNATNLTNVAKSTKTANKKKPNEYKESIGNSVVRILYDSVGFWVSNKSTHT